MYLFKLEFSLSICPGVGLLSHCSDSLEKTLRLGKTEGKGKGGWQRMRSLDNITDSMDMNLSKLWEIVEDRASYSPWGHKVLDTIKQPNNKNNSSVFNYRFLGLLISHLPQG